MFSSGEDATLSLEQHWDDIFEEVNDSQRIDFGNISLSSIFQTHRGRPTQNIDLIFKLLFGISERNLKATMRKKKMQEYLSKVEIKDRRNPQYKRAKTKARTWTATSVRRAYESFQRIIEDGPATKKLYESLSERIETQLASYS